jgi:hypothetical protein
MNANFSKPDWMMPANAIDEPRLARGLVREELRNVSDPFKDPAYLNLKKFMNGLAERYMPRTGKFSTPTAAKLMKQLTKEAYKYFEPFRPFDTKILVQLDDVKASPVHGFFYWMKSKASVTDDMEHKTFTSDFVELRCMRISGSRRRLMFDDTFCHFFINQHCLARMLERGAAPRDALKDLTSQFENVIPVAIMFAAAYKSGHHNEYPHILIPYKDGILLCKVVLVDLTEKKFARWHRFRMTSDKMWTKSDELPLEPLLIHKNKDQVGAVSIYAATYLSKLQMSSEQIWSQIQIQRLMEEERPNFEGYLKMVYLLEDLDPAQPARLHDLYRKMEKIMNNPRWKIATSASLLMQGG